MNPPITHYPFIMSRMLSGSMFEYLWRTLKWERREGAPRREYWWNQSGKPYTYGRGVGQRTYESRPLHEDILVVKGYVKDVTGIDYNACFLNGYEGRNDSIGWHADDDPNIDHSFPIAVVTFGGAREIQFKPIIDTSQYEEKVKVPVYSLMLEPGSLVLMGAGMQKTYLHRIPKAGYDVEPRISLTFRMMKT